MAPTIFAGPLRFSGAGAQLARGADLIANAMKPALGPKGEMVTIKVRHGPRYRTKSGYLIAETIKAHDPYEAMGLRMIKEAASDTYRFSGDGASTTAILAQFILHESVRLIGAGFDAFELGRGIDLATKVVVRELRKNARKAVTPEMAAQVAVISADRDPDVAWIIGETVKSGTSKAVITVEGITRPKDEVRIDPSPDGFRISVVGRTKADAERRRFRIEAAVRTAQSAMEEGVVVGGGAALLHASRALDDLVVANPEQRAGVEIVQHALEVPIRQLAENAQVNGTSIVEKLLREHDVHVGYDIESHCYIDMYRAGIIDSTRAVRTALEGAGSVASAIVTGPVVAGHAGLWSALRRKNPYMHFLLPESPEFAAPRAGRGIATFPPTSSPPPASQGPPGHVPEGQTGSEPPPHRYLLGRFPTQLAKGDTATLIVRISVNPAKGRASRINDLKVPKEGLLLDIAVQADRFEFLNQQRAPIRLLPVGDSTGASFDMRATSEGDTVVRISAFNGGTPIGGLDIGVKITKAGNVAPVTREAAAQPIGSLISNPGDVALVISFNQTTKLYSFGWYDKDGAQPLADLQKSLSEIDLVTSGTIEDIQEIVRMDFRTQMAVAQNRLKQRGIAIWQELIPTSIQSRFIANHENIKRLKIVSDGDPFPWEMIYPFAADPPFDKHCFLVDQAELSRWRFGSLPPNAISLRRADFVIPSDDLEQAQLEFVEVSRLLEAWSTALKGQPIKGAAQLLQQLEAAMISLLHFACHNAIEKSSGRIIVNSDPITPNDYRSLEGRLKRVTPFVFMNACRTDGAPPEYIKVGKKDGWAQRFLCMGVGAFIGTLWEVRDGSAREFAETLYSGLVGGKSFGDALKCAREYLRNKFPGDPTWLAYSFYGAASAHVEKDLAVPSNRAKTME
jgi:hypothetical protein